MKILILEDDDIRIKWFKQNTLGHSVDIIKNAAPAINLIQNKKYDIIFLDHDLGGRVYVDSNEENTGFQCAKKIANSINKDTYVITHTLNSCGAENIKSVLPNVRIIPFTNLKKMICQFIKQGDLKCYNG